MSRFEHHSVQTDESLGRRFCRALDETGETKSEVLRAAIVEYVESAEGDTVDSIERRLDELREEKQEITEARKRETRREESVEARIDDLEVRLDELRAGGDHDELFDDLVDAVQSGADLDLIHDRTDKLERLRALGSYESIETAMQAVEDAVTAGDGR